VCSADCDAFDAAPSYNALTSVDLSLHGGLIQLSCIERRIDIMMRRFGGAEVIFLCSAIYWI